MLFKIYDLFKCIQNIDTLSTNEPQFRQKFKLVCGEEETF